MSWMDKYRKEWLEAHHRTGRTTRMMNSARELAADGKPVIVVFPNHDLRRCAKARFAELVTGLDIRFASVSQLPNLNWETMKLEGSTEDVQVLVNHDVIEQRFVSVLDMLHRFDAPPA